MTVSKNHRHGTWVIEGERDEINLTLQMAIMALRGTDGATPSQLQKDAAAGLDKMLKIGSKEQEEHYGHYTEEAGV